ncbi:MAG: hypothetical protein AB2823_17535, partial [Candidatus Thiodiazotropha endolucinida]
MPMQLIDHRLWFSYRGLPPHQFMPMLGVHKEMHFKKTGHIPPCSGCKGTEFKRSSMSKG